MRKEITTVRNSREGIATIDVIYAEFLATFKRKPKVELSYGELWSPDNVRYPEERYIAAYYEKDGITDMEWMAINASSFISH